MATIGALNVNLALISTEFTAGLTRAAAALESFAGRVTAIVEPGRA